MTSESLRIGSLVAGAGEKARGVYHTPGTAHSMPVTIVNGRHDGKTVLITAGIHGCEYVGIQTAIELARDLDPAAIHGAVIIVHPVNTAGFGQIVPALLPEAGENLNRLFPGDPEGGVGARVAHALTSDFQDRADFHLDLHGGDLNEAMEPFVFYPGAAEAEVTAEARRVAEALDVKYMLKSRAVSGAYNSAAKRGTPSLLIERGGSGVWNAGEVALYKADVFAALHAVGVAAEAPARERRHTPVDVTNPVYVAAERGGCWYPRKRPGERIARGETLGHIGDFFGETLVEYVAEVSGVLLYQACSLAVKPGMEILAYAECGEA